MKNRLLLSLVLLLISEITFAQCTPNPPTGIFGFCPPPSAFPCIEQGQSFGAAIQFENLDTIGGIVFQSLRFDSITNLPSGISYSVFPSPDVAGGQTACIQLGGLTNDAVGTDTLGIYVTVTLAGLGNFSGELGEMFDNFFQLGLLDTSAYYQYEPYYLRVVTPGTPCPTSGLCLSDMNFIAGQVYYDANANGVMDSIDAPMPGVRVDITPASLAPYSNQSGYYYTFLDSGTFNVAVSPPDYYSVSSAHTSYAITFNGIDLDSVGNDFGLTPDTLVNDLSVSITSGFARPGRATSFWINYSNNGTTVLSGSVTFQADSVLYAYPVFTPLPTSQNGNTYTWDFTNLLPWQQQSIYAMMNVPADLNIVGDTLHSFVTISPTSGDATIDDNSEETIQIITNSYDPNDKQVSPDDTKNGIRPDEMLTYTIRFQNTGTDTAFKVVIRDTLDTYLNPASFKTIAASDPYDFQLEGGRYAIWTFDNILLPDSNVDEQGSHGFVKYSIRIKSNAPDNYQIDNSASIYFDINNPVKTNTTKSRVDLNSGVFSPELMRSTVYPNPSAESFTITWNGSLNAVDLQVMDVSGKMIKTLNGLSGDRILLNAKEIENGIYFYQISSNNNPVSRGKLVVMR